MTAGGWLPSDAGPDEPADEELDADGEPEPVEGDSCEQLVSSRRQDARATVETTAGRAHGRPPPFVNALGSTIAILDQRHPECQSYESRWLVQEM